MYRDFLSSPNFSSSHPTCPFYKLGRAIFELPEHHLSDTRYYGPMLTEKYEVAMRDQILRYGIRADGPLAVELGYEQTIRSAKISFRSKTKGKENTWDFRVECGL